MISRLPNLLSLVRLVGTPPLLLAAMAAGSREWFFGLLCVAWLTDALDDLSERLTTADLTRLNRWVELEGLTVEEAATRWWDGR